MEEFPIRIGEVALWLTDHQSCIGDKKTRSEFPPSFKISLNILRFYQILRQNESFHIFLPFSCVDLILCY
jgi:hypothetical protein